MIIATLPSWVNDLIGALPLIGASLAFVGWVAKRWRQWMTEHVVGPISDIAHLVEYHLGPNHGSPRMVDRVIDQGNRLEVLEIVHHTDGVTANEITAMLIERERNHP